MFAKVLIANRGEIACRVIATARRLGIRTIAVYSQADASARHVALADEAHPIGPAPAAKSYLRSARLLKIAKRAGADAVHPGYGFLAENAAFAEACTSAGIVFVGPPAAAIRAMGSKADAARIMEQAGIPVLPGYRGRGQSMASLRRAAGRIGYPVLIKPTHGGGGKGMRLVERAGDFAAALESSRRESAGAFGETDVVLERYLARARHIEVQVFADRHGHVVHLFERDCSIQRRHQKVIEEAPAPGMTAKLRRRMGAVAVAAAGAVGYVGAGTVEFLVDVTKGLAEGAFYFMEMNTRLQVEHPVTEMVTGQDLVEWQFRVAAGEALALTQDDLAIDGHAIEARLYAEDPERGFVPASGTLSRLSLPARGRHLRIDSGVVEGDQITIHYDPMIAKLIVSGADRSAAVRRLGAALATIRVAGVATNLGFLSRLAEHPAFVAGDLDTTFIDRHRTQLLAPRSLDDRELALAALDSLLRRREAALRDAASAPDRHSPWHSINAWRLNAPGRDVLRFGDAGRWLAVSIGVTADGGYLLELPGGTVRARAERDATGTLIAVIDGTRIAALVARQGREVTVSVGAGKRTLLLDDLAESVVFEETASGAVVSPMPGKVTDVKARRGQRVARGMALVVIEAMKMEHTVVAPADGTVTRIHFRPGALVDEGAVLVDFVAEESG